MGSYKLLVDLARKINFGSGRNRVALHTSLKEPSRFTGAVRGGCSYKEVVENYKPDEVAMSTVGQGVGKHKTNRIQQVEALKGTFRGYLNAIKDNGRLTSMEKPSDSSNGDASNSPVWNDDDHCTQMSIGQSYTRKEAEWNSRKSGKRMTTF
ncbi:hypothetical protein Ancab_033695, partial [Ancistrocladus abbreviatus]